MGLPKGHQRPAPLNAARLTATRLHIQPLPGPHQSAWPQCPAPHQPRGGGGSSPGRLGSSCCPWPRRVAGSITEPWQGPSPQPRPTASLPTCQRSQLWWAHSRTLHAGRGQAATRVGATWTHTHLGLNKQRRTRRYQGYTRTHAARADTHKEPGQPHTCSAVLCPWPPGHGPHPSPWHLRPEDRARSRAGQWVLGAKSLSLLVGRRGDSAYGVGGGSPRAKDVSWRKSKQK